MPYGELDDNEDWVYIYWVYIYGGVGYKSCSIEGNHIYIYGKRYYPIDKNGKEVYIYNWDDDDED